MSCNSTLIYLCMYLCLYFIINNFFLIKIKIIFIFPKFPGQSKNILYKYYLIQKYIIQTIITDITTKKNVNDDESKFQISPISLLKFLYLHVKL